ncbi:MAG: FAD-dependent thymidylate synthase [Clostridia bacterium]|nr:FAD-dependent thymidylate synthase [Clostridia bacterium]
MQIKVLASTKVGYEMPKEEAVNFSGKSAGICYMPDSLDTLFSEDEAKTERRAKGTLASGHHSVFGHVTYNLALEGIPKILAMVLNNEKMYNTSEKSARYTKMEPSEKEKELYEKWIKIYQEAIQEKYPEIDEKKVKKLAMENARYLISVFTPATTMEYTVNFGQLNYIAHWFERFIKEAPDTPFNTRLKKVFAEFNEEISNLLVPELNSDAKGRTLSLFAQRKRAEEFGENYCVNYEGTFAELAQAQRHRTLYYEIFIPEEHKYFVPPIIRGTDFEEEWLKDISSLDAEFPQGLMLEINERGTVENFIMKCQERLCGAAQLEIALQTKEILDRYMLSTKDSKKEIYEYLLPFSKGARCTFPGFRCTAPCMWGAKRGIDRQI